MFSRIETSIDRRVPGGTVNSYLLSDVGLLVDPPVGPGKLGVDPTTLDHLAVTHTHPDHVGGVSGFEEAGDITVWALEHTTEEFARRTGVTPDRTVRDGGEIGATGVTVLATPGHTRDHVAFLWDGDGVVGDLARADGSVMVGSPEGDMRAYLTSLRRLHKRDLDTAYPGHGPPLEEPSSRFAAIIGHRLDRERRVQAAVTEGARTPVEIVERAYEKDLSGLEVAARRTVRAHLEKLAVEGRVRWDGTEATSG